MSQRASLCQAKDTDMLSAAQEAMSVSLPHLANVLGQTGREAKAQGLEVPKECLKQGHQRRKCCDQNAQTDSVPLCESWGGTCV